MKITKNYLRYLIKETLQQGSTVDILATLRQNLPLIVNNKLFDQDKRSIAEQMLEDLKRYEKNPDSFSKEDLSVATKYKLHEMLAHIEFLHKMREDSKELRELNNVYHELMKVYNILPQSR